MSEIQSPDGVVTRAKKPRLRGIARLRSRGRIQSMRSRLALWYVLLLVCALGIFAALTLVLVGDASEQSVSSGMRAETRLTTLALLNDLMPTAPYWPKQIRLESVNSFREPGVNVTVMDIAGGVRYTTTTNSDAITDLLQSSAELQRVAHGETIWWTTRIDDEPVRVEGVPIRVPYPLADRAAGTQAVTTGAVTNDGAPTGTTAVIGVLLVSKSLADVATTLQLIRGLLVVCGVLTLAGALAGGWAIADRMLRPLHEIASTANAIVQATDMGTRIGGLQQRIPSPPRRDELADLTLTLNGMLDALDRATQTQQRFVADASHELRAPLTTMRGNLAFLLRHIDELPPGERQAMLNDAHSETVRMAGLVDDLLLLARADASDYLQRADHDAPATVVGAVAEGRVVEWDHALLQVLRQLRGRLVAEGEQVCLEVGQIEPARVRADEETVRRIALIVLDNAFKYTAVKDGSTPRKVTVSLRCEDRGAALYVQDTGIGISAADLPHVFERFFQVDAARRRQGAGLGLAIARTLVEQLGGEISVTSVLGEGSTFCVWLPTV